MHLLVATVLLSACTGGAFPEVHEADSAASIGEGLDLGDEPLHNLVVVQVDTLRADAHPLWGSTRDTFPRLGGRAGWVAVERAVSTASWTAPASASLLTGLDLPRHGVRYINPFGETPRLAAPTFAEHLGAQGYDTALLTGSQVLLLDEFGLARGFDTLRHVTIEPGNGGGVVAEAGKWLAERPSDAPFLLFLQPMDPHGPYQPAPEDLGVWSDVTAAPFDIDRPVEVQEEQIGAALEAATTPAERDAVLAQVRAIYDEQLLALDRSLDALFDVLEASGHLQDTLVVVLADHGESFYDGPPEMLGHGIALREEVVHVPLLFWSADTPESSSSARVVPCVASNVDVFPTALDVLDLPGVPDIDGRSLRAGCRPWAFSGAYEAEGEGGVEQITWLGVQSEKVQVVRDCVAGETLVFDLVSDPAATTRLEEAQVPGAAELRAALDAYGAEVLERLPALTCAGTAAG